MNYYLILKREAIFMNKRSTNINVKTEHGEFIVDKEQYSRFSHNYNLMFERLMHDLADDERVDKIIFGYDTLLEGYTIQIYTTRCALFRINEVFAEDHSNDSALVEKFLLEWSKTPTTEDLTTEQYEGIWKVTGKKIKFTRIWNGYRFNDEQCKVLLDGEHIQFDALSKSGEEKTYIGKLDEQEYKGFRFFGFKLDGWALPKEFHKHVITDKEKALLLAGKEVYLVNLWSEKKQKMYNAVCQYTIKDGLRIVRFDV